MPDHEYDNDPSLTAAGRNSGWPFGDPLSHCRITQTNVRRWLQFASPTARNAPIDAQLCADFLSWLGRPQTACNRMAAGEAIRLSRTQA
jgi:hypothetical protein